MRGHFLAVCGLLLTPAFAAAQATVTLEPGIGVFVPTLDLVKFENARTPNVELQPGPTVGAELLLTLANRWLGFYGSFRYAFSQLEHTSALETQTAPQPSSDVDLLMFTGGLSLTPSIGWEHLRPRLVAGGGLKRYDFDLVETGGLGWFTFEYGVGVTAAPLGSWEGASVLITAEFRQFVSKFDPATLPIRVRSAENQWQFDNLFLLGLRFRLGQRR